VHHLRREVIPVPLRVKTLRPSAGLLGVGDITALLDETAELAHADFGAAHPEAVLDPCGPRIALGFFTRRPRRGAAFDSRGPGAFFRRASHEEFAGRNVNDFQAHPAAEIDLLRRALGRLDLLGRAGR